MRTINGIIEKALRAAILSWDAKYKEDPANREIFKLQAEEAVQVLIDAGKDVRTIARRNA